MAQINAFMVRMMKQSIEQLHILSYLVVSNQFGRNIGIRRLKGLEYSSLSIDYDLHMYVR